MTRTRLVVLTAAVTAVVLLFVIGVLWAAMKMFDGVGRTELLSECEYDATASGAQGYCVVVSRYPGAPVHSQRTYLEIAQVHDGHPIDLRFRAAYPFGTPYDAADVDVAIDWTQVEKRIMVTDRESGSSVTYTFDQYGTIR